MISMQTIEPINQPIYHHCLGIRVCGASVKRKNNLGTVHCIRERKLGRDQRLVTITAK